MILSFRSSSIQRTWAVLSQAKQYILAIGVEKLFHWNIWTKCSYFLNSHVTITNSLASECKEYELARIRIMLIMLLVGWVLFWAILSSKRTLLHSPLPLPPEKTSDSEYYYCDISPFNVSLFVYLILKVGSFFVQAISFSQIVKRYLSYMFLWYLECFILLFMFEKALFHSNFHLLLFNFWGTYRKFWTCFREFMFHLN